MLNTTNKLLVSIILIGLIILARLLPHLPNFVPVTAAGLVAGAYLGRRWAFGVILVGMLVADIFLGFYHFTLMLSVYLSFATIAWLAGYLKKYKTIKIVLIYSLGSSLIFYLVTNFAVWVATMWYPKNLTGLLLAYEMGLPFLRYTLLGDLFYTVVLFASFELVLSFLPMLLSKKLAKDC